MSGHLCLKWNNHSSAFLKNIIRIQIKERFADATIICGGKYFAVHRIVLSTCSDYFDEVFDRIQCQHPYIVFKDIDSNDMELLLNYMYHGEVTVTQGCLPALIKAAEVLRVKGLAVPDDDISSGEILPEKKKKIEEHKRRKTNSSEEARQITDHTEVMIKEEPQDHPQLEDDLKNSMVSLSNGNEVKHERADDYPMNSLDPGNSHLKKNNDTVIAEPLFEEQSSNWASFETSDPIATHPPNPYTSEDDIQAACQIDTNVLPKAGPLLTTPNSSRDLFRSESSDQVGSESLQRCTYPGCVYQTQLNNELQMHIKRSHVAERSHFCPVCQKRFNWKVNCDIHMRIHTGVKPYKCPHCDMKFRHSNSLRRHLSKQVKCKRKFHISQPLG